MAQASQYFIFSPQFEERPLEGTPGFQNLDSVCLIPFIHDRLPIHGYLTSCHHDHTQNSKDKEEERGVFSNFQNCVSEAVFGTLANFHLLGSNSLANHTNCKEIWGLHLHFECHMPS